MPGSDHTEHVLNLRSHCVLQWNHGAGTVGEYPVDHVVDYVRVWEKVAGGAA